MNRSGTFTSRAASTLAIGALAFGSALALGTAVAAEPGAPAALTLSQDSGLSDGQSVTVNGAGADPEGGYYLATCVIGTQGPTGPDCPMDSAVWLSNTHPGATDKINLDGTFTAELKVAQTGETMAKAPIDCGETPCAVTLFADHMNGFGQAAGTPISFGSAATPPSAAPAEGGAGTQVAAESSEDSSSNAVWWIVGGAIVVGAIAGGAVAYSKKS